MVKNVVCLYVTVFLTRRNCIRRCCEWFSQDERNKQCQNTRQSPSSW